MGGSSATFTIILLEINLFQYLLQVVVSLSRSVLQLCDESVNLVENKTWFDALYPCLLENSLSLKVDERRKEKEREEKKEERKEEREEERGKEVMKEREGKRGGEEGQKEGKLIDILTEKISILEGTLPPLRPPLQWPHHTNEQQLKPVG